jgi:hypothetical protein
MFNPFCRTTAGTKKMRPTDFEAFIAAEGYVRAPDSAKKRKALQKAAKRGCAASQNSLATLYLYGYGVPQNLAEAAKWFEKAADQGDASAQFSLAEMYWGGEGVPQDAHMAEKWFRKAAEQGDAAAQRALAFLSVDTRQITIARAIAAGKKAA